MKKTKNSNLVIYKSEDGPLVSVKFSDESIWLTQRQMAELFDKDSDTIGLHIKNIFSTGELNKKATTEDFSVVQKEGKRNVKRTLKHYNLDMIISVGYRVNSKKGTQFRIWATNILKQYLTEGYVINEKQLKEQTKKIKALETTIKSIVSAAHPNSLSDSAAKGILNVIQDYTLALDLLDQYDHQRLEIKHTKKTPKKLITYKAAQDAINSLRDKFKKDGESVELFGREKDDSFHSSISTIYQTFNGKSLYPSIEEQAAHLLYFVIKNHSFVDGNKRIAAFLFVWFLENHDYLYMPNGKKRIEDNGLVALCLLVAHSKPEEKDTFVKLIVNLINKNVV